MQNKVQRNERTNEERTKEKKNTEKNNMFLLSVDKVAERVEKLLQIKWMKMQAKRFLSTVSNIYKENAGEWMQKKETIWRKMK